MNSAGGICKDDTPYLQMFDFTKCANLNPTTVDSFSSLQCPTPSICVAACPDEFSITIPVQGFTGNLTCDVGVVPADPSTVQGVQDLIQQLAEDKCIKYTIPSQPVLNRCLPKIPASNIVDVASTFVNANGDSITTPDGTELNPEILSKAVDIFNSAMSYQEFFNKILSDLQNSWHWILIGLGAALLLSFVFMFLIRCLVGPVIYLLMVVIVAALGFGCYFTFTRWKELEALDLEQGAIWENAMTWRNIFIICVVSEVILTLLFIFCISRVRVAVEVISQASTAVWSNLSTLFFPIVTSVMIIVCIAYWAMVSLFLVASREATYQETSLNGSFTGVSCNASQAENETSCKFFDWSGESWYHKNLTLLQVINLALALWCINWTIALGEMTLAGAFASWYWAFKKPQDLPLTPIFASFGRALRYHTGTIAFGSLIITLIQLARIALEYVDRKLKHSENPFAKFIMCCLRCCLWCLEKLMRAINRNAYIMTAIYGHHFCKSCCKALGLLTRNLVRTVVLGSISFFVLLMGKIVVTVVMGGLSWAFFYGPITSELDKLEASIANSTLSVGNLNLNNTILTNIGDIDTPELNYYWLPILVIVIGTWLVASTFFGVYGMAIDTIYLSFLEDMERNEGTEEKPYFAPKGLMKVLGKSNEVKKK